VRDDRLRLADMLEAIELIEKYARRGRNAFEEDELIRAWIVHHLEILGEACRGSDEFRGMHPDELWSDVVSFRNVLAHQYFGIDHQYFGIDLEAVREVVVRDLPELKKRVLEILEPPATTGDAS
jgi:uncharacterized protein with HEPN domain